MLISRRIFNLIGSVVFFASLLLLPGRAAFASVDTNGNSIVVQLKTSEKLYTVACGSEAEQDRLINFFSNEPQVTHIQKNAIYRAARVPNDAYYNSQWYLTAIDAPAAWDSATGTREVVVAVLDSGVDIDHPDLASNIWINAGEVSGNGIDDDSNGYSDDVYGWDFVADSSDPNPKYEVGWTEAGVYHGTAVAGVVGAVTDNVEGIAGIGWNITIMPIRVLDGSGLGDTKSVYQGISYAIQNGADIINLSFVGDSEDEFLTQAISEAEAAGVLITAAAGNEGINLNVTPRYPACNPNVMGIGGTDQDDNRLILTTGEDVSGGSNYGDECVDVSAPASNIFSTVVYDEAHNLTSYYRGGWSGTSMATPIVSGAAALLLAENPSLSLDQLRSLIIAAVDPINYANETLEGQLGSGRINLASAFQEPIITVNSIIAGAGYTGGPHVRIFDAGGNRSVQFFAYAESFRGGVNVAAGDVDGDGIEEIIAGAGTGGGPHIRI
ncbi:MAG: S8 family peptidase, partial [Patescibacteria group bacterium]